MADDETLDFSNFKPMGWMWNGHIYQYVYNDEGEIIGHFETEGFRGGGKGFSWEITIGSPDDEDPV